MPIPVFSKVLWELGSTPTSGQQVLSNPVPTGFTWVVQSIAAANNSPQARTAAAHLEFFVDGFLSWATPFNEALRGDVFNLFECRFVLEQGSFLGAASLDAATWRVRVCGYELTN